MSNGKPPLVPELGFLLAFCRLGLRPEYSYLPLFGTESQTTFCGFAALHGSLVIDFHSMQSGINQLSCEPRTFSNRRSPDMNT